MKPLPIFLFLIFSIKALAQGDRIASSDKDISVIEKGDSIRLYYKDGLPFSILTFDNTVPRYPYYSFCEGLMLVEKSGKAGYLNNRGEVVIDMEYDIAKPFMNGLGIVYKNSKWGVIDKSDNIITPLTYDEISEFKNGLARVQLESKYGFINQSGKVTIPIEYTYANDFEDGLIIAHLNKVGVIE